MNIREKGMISMTMEMYRVTDIQTNTVLENLSIKQVASTLGVRTGYIHTCIKNGNLIRFRYKVEVVGTVECKCCVVAAATLVQNPG